ncbi:hypothetical protein QMK19_01235 [Streptomyces sp. H10-C2]|uniref:hypothetical protein n=1 Tax=unclassified Streptomyces TaxID=2593676 RepID=UPI0024B898BE|nr:MULTISPECIES: hypothetical protein [unclassified Streptomyces]MDJ0340211.1 hypothetical protein [Streptomyces sp. PH10-H1]MDJ0368340.1 hypothetical protein [Streptomyces sp. H10-C2]
MTSTTGMDSHPEVSEISDLAEGILPPGRSADVRGHLDTCGLCADVRTSLDEIRNLLGTLPGPPRMPADIAGRIDAALAAEALLDSTAPADVSRGTPAAATVPRGTAPTADRPEGRSPAPAGPGRDRARPRRRRARTLLIAASTVAVLGLGGILVNSIGPGSSNSAKGTSAVSSPRAGDESVKKSSIAPGGDLQVRVHELLRSAPGSGGDVQSPALGGETTPTETVRGTGALVPACVKNAIHRTEQPLAAAHEPYEGTDSYLVVLPHPGDKARVDAYVVDASCSTAPGRVLHEDTYAR